MKIISRFTQLNYGIKFYINFDLLQLMCKKFITLFFSFE